MKQFLINTFELSSGGEKENTAQIHADTIYIRKGKSEDKKERSGKEQNLIVCLKFSFSGCLSLAFSLYFAAVFFN